MNDNITSRVSGKNGVSTNTKSGIKHGINKIIYPLLFILILLLIPCVSARSGSMTLLSVAEINGQLEGRTADLFLEIEAGHGRVFIDTFPLTMLDTLISTRFANEITCDFLNRDCSRVDFFYNIRSNAPLLGGPSAGSSVAVLTVSLIDDVKLDSKTAITGTINSGGIIGPVGGLKEKIDAAFDAGLNKVLIPPQNGLYVLGNDSIDLILYGESLGIKVVEVETLNQAMYEFTGKIYEKESGEIIKSDLYIQVINNISNTICDKAFVYNSKIKKENDDYDPLVEEAEMLVVKAKDAFSNNNPYSAASYCFGSNIDYIYVDLLRKNMSDEEIDTRLNQLKINVDAAFVNLDNYELETITDLQAYMVVRERLLSMKEHVDLAYESTKKEEIIYHIVYSEERYLTAKLWSEFLDKGGNKVQLELNLKTSCIKKITETQERIEYVRYFFPMLDDSFVNSLGFALVDMQNEDYALCLFKASKTKAEVEVLVQSLSSNLDLGVIERKLSIVKQIIAEQKTFPLLGYSYYEYATSLKKEDLVSSLLYSEYSLEMSNLEMYFGDTGKLFILFDYKLILLFVCGGMIGIYVTSIVLGRRIKKIKKQNKIKNWHTKSGTPKVV